MKKIIYDISFSCNTCGPFIKAFRESYVRGIDDPYCIEILDPIGDELCDEISYNSETIELKSKPEGEMYKLSYCGHCGTLIGYTFHKRWGKKPIRLRRRYINQ
mgnify:CR=1 FL=1|tara:strand:- start:12 stop:320 length:309 start_codon:yes stop_codon:yes gene_type:complete